MFISGRQRELFVDFVIGAVLASRRMSISYIVTGESADALVHGAMNHSVQGCVLLESSAPLPQHGSGQRALRWHESPKAEVAARAIIDSMPTRETLSATAMQGRFAMIKESVKQGDVGRMM